MNDWTEQRRTLVQLSFDAYDDMLNRERHPTTEVIVEVGGDFAIDILWYLCKDIAVYGTPEQKRRILQIMESTFQYVWDENERRYVNIEGHPSTPGLFWWSDLVDYAFDCIDFIHYRNSIIYELSKRLLFDIAPMIILQGSEEQLIRFNAFLDQNQTAGVL